MCWYVAYSKSRSEFKAVDYFDKCGVTSYVPSYNEKREWSDRTKNIRVPAISGYVFFEFDNLDYSIVNLNPFLRNVLKKYGKAITIKNEEILALKSALCGFNVSEKILPGDNIKILSGAFKNRLGLVDCKDDNSLTVLINSMKVRLSLADTRLKSIA